MFAQESRVVVVKVVCDEGGAQPSQGVERIQGGEVVHLEASGLQRAGRLVVVDGDVPVLTGLTGLTGLLNANARHRDILAAECKEGVSIRGEKDIR
ncbi:hypothetical protein [Streptomyces sp. NPDC021212]|uniref:hypothetical protein n=1 Tax=Streptomyces sp. NPDC021212 TaxID=3365118 RepID=UPI00378794BF